MTPDRGQVASRAPTSRVAALGLAEQWFVTDDKGRTGPYSAARLARMLERGELAWTSQVWREGLKDWRPARRDDLLIFAVASVRGMASDTSRLDTLGDLLQQDDTRVEAERRFADDDERRFAADVERAERFASATESAKVVPPDAPLQLADAASEDTRPTVRPLRLSWPLRLSTPLIAVGAFAAGALLTQLAHRFVTGSAHGEHPDAPAASSPRPAPAVSAAALAARDDRAGATSPQRPRPDAEELEAELTRLEAPVHRCVRRAGALDVSLVIDGDSGRVDPARVQAKGVRAARLACVARALGTLEVAPFAATEYAVAHQFRW
ncbi:MAG: DUF4339 domain-containing protein [Polyangiales bacterium]